MNKILSDIFKKDEFEKNETDSFVLFSLRNKTSYWIVKEINSLDFIQQQDELFLEAKKVVGNNPNFDKNASLLLLYKVDDTIDIVQLKEEILNIEEDPYQFKKQVLFYTEDSKEELSNELLQDSIETILSKQTIFEEYKNEFDLFSWKALLYRIAHKVPFVHLKIEENKDLASLFVDNKNVVKKAGLGNLDDMISDSFPMSIDAIGKMKPEDVFELLLTDEEKKDELEDK